MYIMACFILMFVLYSGIGYFLSEPGKYCAEIDSTTIAVADANECQLALLELKSRDHNVVFETEQNTIKWPKGCYGKTSFYWNNHVTGNKTSFMEYKMLQICKVIG